MSSIIVFALGGPEIFVIMFMLILVPLPLFIAYKIGFNQGKRKGRLEIQAELYQEQNMA